MATTRPNRERIVAFPLPSRIIWAGSTQDTTYALRLLRRQPGFAAVAMLTMALGIGASTTLFSVTYGVLLKPLMWPDADRLVRITETHEGRGARVRGTLSNGPYYTWAAEHSTIEAIGGWLNVPSSTIVIGNGEPMQLQTAAVTPSLFTVLKARPHRGRLFVDDDVATLRTTRSIILSYGLWQEGFGGAEDAVGRVVQVDGKAVTVLGVMAKEFAFPNRETRAWTPWLPPAVLGEGPVIRMTTDRVCGIARSGSHRRQGQRRSASICPRIAEHDPRAGADIRD